MHSEATDIRVYQWQTSIDQVLNLKGYVKSDYLKCERISSSPDVILCVCVVRSLYQSLSDENYKNKSVFAWA